MHPLIARLTEFFARHIRPEGRVILAVSGGVDSVALAHLASCLREKRLFQDITIAHLNHHLRGDESDADEAFVEAFAKRLGVTVETSRIDVAARAQDRNLEDAAREIRYQWLSDVAGRHHAHWIATAHTADDQAETVLHHFLRGSGLAGLAGIAERRPISGEVELVRPLLNTRRHEIVGYLRDHRIEFRVDSSNLDVAFTRNRLRHEIIPLLERAVNRSLVDVLVRTAGQARECQAAVTEIAEGHLASVERPRADSMLVFSRPDLAKLSAFFIREVFRLAWKREGWPMGLMNAADWQRLVSLVDGTLAAHDFPQGVRARSKRHVVQLWRERKDD